MNEKFLRNIEDAVQRLAGDGYRVERRTIAKGTESVDALCIGYAGSSLQAVVYPEEGITTTIEEQAADLFATAQRFLQRDSESLTKTIKDVWKNLPERVSIKLVNADWQREYLKDKIHRICFGELAVVPVVCLDGGSIEVNKGAWDEEEILAAGFRNFVAAEKKCEPLESLLQKIAPELAEVQSLPEDLPKLYVLTAGEATFGGACLLDKEFLERVHDVIGHDYYVLPSSIYELLCISTDVGGVEDFQKMIKCVNRDHVVYDERLSDSLYVYREGKVERVGVNA